MIMSARRVLVGAGRPPQDHVIVTKQDQHEVAAGAMLGEHAWPGKLHGELCALIAPVFAHARSRFAAFAYVAALLAAARDPRSCWQLGEQAAHETPRRMHALPGEYAWDWRAALEQVPRVVTAALAVPATILEGRAARQAGRHSARRSPETVPAPTTGGDEATAAALPSLGPGAAWETRSCGRG